jgi:hypothetical protein
MAYQRFARALMAAAALLGAGIIGIPAGTILPAAVAASVTVPPG